MARRPRRNRPPPIAVAFQEYDVGGPIILDRERERITIDLLLHLQDGGTIEGFCKARAEWIWPDEYGWNPVSRRMRKIDGRTTTHARRYRRWVASALDRTETEIPITSPVFEPEPEPWAPPEEIEGVCYQGHQLETRNRDGRAVCINGHEA